MHSFISGNRTYIYGMREVYCTRNVRSVWLNILRAKKEVSWVVGILLL
jgi:hypothetical protein